MPRRTAAPSKTRPKTSPKQDVRAAVLEKATELTAASGFAGISLQDVATEVGVAKQSVLYHFESKEALKLAIVDHLLERANQSLSTLLGELPRSSGDRLDTILSHINDFLEAEPHAAAVFLRFLLDDDPAAVERIRTGARPWFGFLEDALKSAQRAGDVRPELDPEVAVLQVGMLVITNFALLPHSWTGKSTTEAWKRRRLRELVRAIGFILSPRA